MINWIDALYLVFATLVLFFSFLFILLFAQNRGVLRSVPKIARLPFVSIVIPAYNEADNIAKTVRNLKALDYPKGKYEILVIDDGSEDETAAISRACGARVISQPNRGKASALNTGLKYARGEIVACVDADSYPQADALKKSVPFFSDKTVAAVTSKIFVKNDRTFLGKLQRIEYAMIAWSRKLFEYVDSIYVTPGPLALYRSNLLRQVGGFDETNVTEDIEIAWRLLDKGYKIKMSPAITSTEVPSTLRKWWHQRIRWNVGGIQTSLKYKGAMFRHDSFGFFILPFFTLSYALSLLALSLFMYLIYFWAYNNVSFMLSASAAGANPLKHFTPLFLPDLFTIFGVVIFAFAIFLVAVGMKEMEHSRGPRMWIHMLVYLSIYITVFPVILVHSIIRYLKGYRKW